MPKRPHSVQRSHFDSLSACAARASPATIKSMSDKSGGGAVAGAQPGPERRRSQRVPVEMWVEEVSEEERVFRRAGNLSEGGLHLDKTIPIAVGTVINLRFTLPSDPDPIDVKGEIVAIDPDEELGMGVKFVDMPADLRGRIKHYLDRALTPVA